MASSRLKTTKSGKRFYEIRFQPGRDAQEFSMRWYIPEGWSKRAIERELRRQEADFERRCEAGEIKTRSMKQAEKAAREAEEAKLLTIQQYAERVVIPRREELYAIGSRECFKRAFRLRIIPALGGIRVRDISPAQISAFLLDRKEKGDSKSTMETIIWALRQLFHDAVKVDSMREIDPMPSVSKPRQSKEERAAARAKKDTEKTLSLSELKRLREYANGMDQKWKALISFLIDSGCRCGEACGLRWEDIDFRSATVEISGTACYVSGNGVVRTSTKSGNTRTIDVSRDVVQDLVEWRFLQQQLYLSPYVFTNDDGSGMLNPDTVTHRMTTVGKAIGIKRLHPHLLRHSWASLALQNGADVLSVSRKLGHSDVAITLSIYSHASADSIKAAGDVFRAALEQKNA